MSKVNQESPDEPSDREAAFDDLHDRWEEDLLQFQTKQMADEERWMQDHPEPVWISDQDQADMDRETRDGDERTDLFRDMGITDEPLSEQLFNLGASCMKVQGEQVK